MTMSLSSLVGVSICGFPRNDINNLSIGEVIVGSFSLSILPPPRWFLKSMRNLVHPRMSYCTPWLGEASPLDQRLILSLLERSDLLAALYLMVDLFSKSTARLFRVVVRLVEGIE